MAGFGVVFTLLGVTATFAGGGLFRVLPQLRQLGGIVLIVMGLSLAGILRIGVLDRVWRPLQAGGSAALATTTGTIAFGSPGAGPEPSRLDRLGGRLVGRRGGYAASFGLGAIFAIGWTPCLGIALGAILTMASTQETVAQGGVLLFAYTIGLGVPFLVLGLLYDRAPAHPGAAGAARPRRVPRRRPARRGHRRRDAHGLADPPAALLQLHPLV